MKPAIPALLSFALLSLAACSDDNPSGADVGVGVDLVLPSDTGRFDQGVTPDSGPADTGDDDTGVIDSGDTDGGPGDTGDAGTTDTGTTDTGTADTGATDTGAADTGTADTGTADTGAADTGTADTGAADTGGPNDAGTPTDTGTPDSGSPDTGVDAGAPDTGGAPDAGFGDTTCVPNFGQADACGGNPVGSWDYADACISTDLLGSALVLCPSAAISNQQHVVSGSLTMNNNLTYTRALNNDITMDVLVPNICLQAPVNNCNDLAMFMQQFISGTNVVVSCNSTGSACDCAIAIDYDFNDSGTYTFNTLTGIATLNGTEDYYYCTSQNVLKYRGTPQNAADNALSYVLTRQ